MFRRKDDPQDNYQENSSAPGMAQSGGLRAQRGAPAAGNNAPGNPQQSPMLRKPAPQQQGDNSANAEASAQGGTSVASHFSRSAAPSKPAAEKSSTFRSSADKPAARKDTDMNTRASSNNAPAARSEFAPRPEPMRPVAPATSPAQAFEADRKTPKRVLTVGQDTLLKGEISTCDRLVVQGSVDAVLTDVHTIEITESGTFKGSAIVENAEISGLFEGDLEVHGHLTILSTGRVMGKVSYSEIEVHRGGQLSGQVVLAEQDSASNPYVEDIISKHENAIDEDRFNSESEMEAA